MHNTVYIRSFIIYHNNNTTRRVHIYYAFYAHTPTTSMQSMHTLVVSIVSIVLESMHTS